MQNNIAAVDREKAVRNRTLMEMNALYKDCPIQINSYEVDGTEYIVTSHFIGDRDIKDVMMQYAEDRAMNEMLGIVPASKTT